MSDRRTEPSGRAGSLHRLRVRSGYQLAVDIEAAVHSTLFHEGEGRRRMASALGYALAGGRGSAWLDDRDFLRSLDLVEDAMRQRVPLLIYLELTGDHRPAYVAVELGLPVFLAGSPSTMIAEAQVGRRAAEEALSPVVVAVDGTTCSRSPADLVWPGSAELHKFVRPAGELRPSAAPVDEAFFGDARSVVPAWFDVDRPLASNVSRDRWSEGAGRAAAAVHLDPRLDMAIRNAWQDWSSTCVAEGDDATLGPFRIHKTSGEVKRTVITTGPAYVAAVEALGEDSNVIAVDQLSPFPRGSLTEAIEGDEVWILDRAPVSFDGSLPLSRLLGGSLTDAEQPSESKVHRGTAILRRFLHLNPNEPTETHQAVWGLGGSPLRVADLSLLRDAQPASRTVYVGQEFLPTVFPDFPHREAYFGKMRRERPDLVGLGLKADDTNPGVSEEVGGALRIEVPWDSGSQAADTARIGHVAAALEFVARILDATVQEVQTTAHGATRTFRVRPQGSDSPLDASASPTLRVSLESSDDGGSPGSDTSAFGLSQRAAALLLASLRQVPELSPRALDAVAVRSRFSTADSDEELHAKEQWLEAVLTLADSFQEVSETETNTKKGTQASPEANPDADARTNPESRTRTTSMVQNSRGGSLDDHPDALSDLSADGTLLDVARFRHHVAEGWGRTDPDPEPHSSVPTLPPATASLWKASSTQAPPALQALACTGCGDCWSVCPESAFSVRSFDAADVFTSLLDAVGKAGKDASLLRRSARSLTSAMAEAGMNPNASRLSDLVHGGFDAWSGKNSKNAEAAKELRPLIKVAAKRLEAAPLVRPSVPVGRSEREGLPKPTEGGFVSLAIDPDACTACGLCTQVCREDALEPGFDREDALQVFSAVGALPPMDAAATQRLTPFCGELAGSSAAATGVPAFSGRPNRPGSGQASAIRSILQALEWSWDRSGLVQSIENLQRETAERVQQELGRAATSSMSKETSEGLLPAMNADPRQWDALDLRSLAKTLEDADRDGRIDSEYLARGVELGRFLADLRWRFDGASGVGRRSAALVLGPGMEWVSQHPTNAVSTPTVTMTDPRAVIGVAEGVLRSMSERAARETNALRQAVEWLDDAGPASASGKQPDPLTVKQLQPRLVLLVDESSWSPTSDALRPLVATGSPVWVVLMSRPSSVPTEGRAPSASPVAVSLADGNALPVQTSPLAPRHMNLALSAAAQAGGPVVLRVLVAEPEVAGLGDDVQEEVKRSWEAVRDEIESGRFSLGVWNAGGERLDRRVGPDSAATAVGAGFGDAVPDRADSDGAASEADSLRDQISRLRAEIASAEQSARKTTEDELVRRLARRLGEVSKLGLAAAGNRDSRNGGSAQ